jgi:hypothetical protein
MGWERKRGKIDRAVNGRASRARAGMPRHRRRTRVRRSRRTVASCELRFTVREVHGRTDERRTPRGVTVQVAAPEVAVDQGWPGRGFVDPVADPLGQAVDRMPVAGIEEAGFGGEPCLVPDPRCGVEVDSGLRPRGSAARSRRSRCHGRSRTDRFPLGAARPGRGRAPRRSRRLADRPRDARSRGMPVRHRAPRRLAGRRAGCRSRAARRGRRLRPGTSPAARAGATSSRTSRRSFR